MDSGTGQVHIAPGHGADDYIAGNGERPADLVSCRRAGAVFTEEVGRAGVGRANMYSMQMADVIAHLKEKGMADRAPGLQARLPALLAFEDPDRIPCGGAIFHQDRCFPQGGAQGYR